MDFNYYFNRLQDISALDPESYFVITDDCLLIRVDHFLNKHHRFDMRELIEDIVARFSSGRVVFFYFYDGGNPNLSGFKEFLQHLQDQNRLDAAHTVVATYQKTDIPNAVVIYTPISPFLSNTYVRLKDTPLLPGEFNKHFGCLIGRYNPYRIRLAMHVQTHHSESTVLSCQMKPESMFSLRHKKLIRYYETELSWIDENLPIKPQPVSTTRMGSVDWGVAIDQGLELYSQFFIDIVSETDYNSPDWFTEKVFKTFMFGRPFILWAGPHALKSLHALGFITFGGFIDESYDNITNDRERFNAILSEIDRLSSKPIGELKYMHSQMQKVFAHNRENMGKLHQFMFDTPWEAFTIL